MQFRIPRWLIWLDDRIMEPVRDWCDVPIGVKIHGYVVRRWDVCAVIATIVLSVFYAWSTQSIVGFFIALLTMIFAIMVWEWIF